MTTTTCGPQSIPAAGERNGCRWRRGWRRTSRDRGRELMRSRSLRSDGDAIGGSGGCARLCGGGDSGEIGSGDTAGSVERGATGRDFVVSRCARVSSAVRPSACAVSDRPAARAAVACPLAASAHARGGAPGSRMSVTLRRGGESAGAGTTGSREGERKYHGFFLLFYGFLSYFLSSPSVSPYGYYYYYYYRPRTVAALCNVDAITGRRAADLSF